MKYLSLNCTEKEIKNASDQKLIISYSSAPFDYDDWRYDAIAEELANRNLLEDNN